MVTGLEERPRRTGPTSTSQQPTSPPTVPILPRHTIYGANKIVAKKQPKDSGFAVKPGRPPSPQRRTPSDAYRTLITTAFSGRAPANAPKAPLTACGYGGSRRIRAGIPWFACDTRQPLRPAHWPPLRLGWAVVGSKQPILMYPCHTQKNQQKQGAHASHSSNLPTSHTWSKKAFKPPHYTLRIWAIHSTTHFCHPPHRVISMV